MEASFTGGFSFHPELVGRENELSLLSKRLQEAASSIGSTMLVSGEAGIGKTRLVSELIGLAETEGVQVVRGWCLAESLEPLMPVREALRDTDMEHIISGSPPPRVVSAYLMTDAGVLLASSEREESGLDPDIFASMLTAVGSFVKDSLGMMGKQGAGLNSIGYDRYKIVLQSRGMYFLAVVLEGSENEFLIDDMGRILRDTEASLGKWTGDMQNIGNTPVMLSRLAGSGKYDGKFLVDDPKLRRENLFDNVLLGLQRASEKNPVLFFLDDMHWADPTTLSLLHYLARNTRRNRVMLLGTYRPEDVFHPKDGQSHPLETTLQNMSREDLFQGIQLKRLAPDDMETFLASVLGQPIFDKSFLEKIHQETGGNPFFILEVVKLLLENKTIIEGERGLQVLAQNVDSIDIPSKIYDVIKRRLDRLSTDQRDIMEFASVVGEEFSTDIIGKALDIKRITLLRSLGEIENAHDLFHSTKGKYRFDHAKIREVLYNGMLDELRMEYHKMAAETILDLKGREDSTAALLAHHYSEAGDSRAVEYLILAGDSAKEKYANEEALNFYSRALEISNNMGFVLEKLADVQSLLGDYGSAIENYHRAGEAAGDKDIKARNRRKAGVVYRKRGEYDRSLEELSAARDLVEEGTEEYGNILLDQGTSYIGKGDYDDALDLLSQAIELSEELESEGIKGSALRFKASIYYMRGECQQALEYCNISLAIMESIGDMWGLAAVLNNIGLMNKDRGDMDAAREAHEKSLEILESIGDKWGILLNLNNIGLIHHDKGEMEEALRLYFRSLEIAENIGDKSSTALVLDSIGETLLEKKDFQGALQAYQRSLEIAESIGGKLQASICHCGLAIAKTNLGKVQEGLEHAEKARKIVLEMAAKTEEIRVRIALGRVHKTLMNWDRAAEEIDKAISISNETGRDRESACALYEKGILLRDMNRPEECRELLNKALAEFQEMGLDLWADKCLKSLK